MEEWEKQESGLLRLARLERNVGVLSATGESSFPTGLNVRWSIRWSGEEKDGAEGGRGGEREEGGRSKDETLRCYIK